MMRTHRGNNWIRPDRDHQSSTQTVCPGASATTFTADSGMSSYL
ncbi:MAG: hypothetical protein U0176_14790 [Bacteroidia bacterium]